MKREPDFYVTSHTTHQPLKSPTPKTASFSTLATSRASKSLSPFLASLHSNPRASTRKTFLLPPHYHHPPAASSQCPHSNSSSSMRSRGRQSSPWILYFDGATRGSGGPAGLGAVLKDNRGHVVATVKAELGERVSPSEAEYKALIAGLEKAKMLNVRYLIAKGDSFLVLNQVFGEWEVRDDTLMKYCKKVKDLARKFKSFQLVHIPRELNEAADKLANEAIDVYLKKAEALKAYGLKAYISSDSDFSDDERYIPPAYTRPRYLTSKS